MDSHSSVLPLKAAKRTFYNHVDDPDNFQGEFSLLTSRVIPKQRQCFILLRSLAALEILSCRRILSSVPQGNLSHHNRRSASIPVPGTGTFRDHTS